MRSLLLAITLALTACATAPGPSLEDCLRGGNVADVDPIRADPMDSLITQAIDERRETFLCPTPRHVIGGL
jgi:hypothetical protein